MTAKESGVPVFLQMAIRPETEKQIRQTATLTDLLINNYPVWKLKNRGDTDSVGLTARTFEDHLVKLHAGKELPHDKD